MEKHNLDLSRKKCHACGQQLWKDIARQKEMCIHHACLIRRVGFTIPALQEEK